MPGRRLRVVVFALVSLALALAAISSGSGGERKASMSTPYQPSAPTPGPSRPPGPQLDPRPFLRAFLRYEVGELDSGLRHRLRATTTPGFNHQLLSAPVRRLAQRLPAAQLGSLSVTYLSRQPPRALVSGRALRAGQPEQFGFLFEARRGTWSASGPAE